MLYSRKLLRKEKYLYGWNTFPFSYFTSYRAYSRNLYPEEYFIIRLTESYNIHFRQSGINSYIFFTKESVKSIMLNISYLFIIYSTTNCMKN